MKALKWVFFLPIAVISSGVCCGFSNLILHWVLPGVVQVIFPKWEFLISALSILAWSFAGIMGSIIWMMVGTQVAPKRTKLVKWVLLIPLISVMLLALYVSIVGDFAHVYAPISSIKPKIGQIILSSAGLLGSIMFIFTEVEIEED